MLQVVCCIDVGIRNLSICIISSEYEILLWNVYNVLESDDHTCNGMFKNGKICGRNCTMKYKDSKNVNGNNVTIYTCKSHFPKDIKQTRLNTFKKKNVKDYLMQDIAKAIIRKMDEICLDPVFDKVTSIFLELQPKINRKAVFASDILYGMLVSKYIDTCVPIRHVSARKKLRLYDGPVLECRLKGAYAKRKWTSIQHVDFFLKTKFPPEQMEKWLNVFIGHKKQDDMSDALLYCIHALKGF